MAKEALLKQKASYETQFNQAESRLQQLTAEVERVTTQREQLRGAIFALESAVGAMTPPPAPESEKKALEVVKDSQPTQDKSSEAPPQQ